MKKNPTRKTKVLILSDGKQGHLNQSIAFCKIKDIDFDTLDVVFKSRFHKAIAYVFSWLGLFSASLYAQKLSPDSQKHSQQLSFENNPYKAVVSTGTATYYANLVLGKKFGAKSVVLMYPKGYPIGRFDHIIAQSHDRFKAAANIIKVPLNLSYLPSNSGFEDIKSESSVAIIIGGSNQIFTMSAEKIKSALDRIFAQYPDHKKYITTSRRTPKEVELLLADYDFDYKVIFSQTPNVNPIGEFVNQCQRFFITMDSTSMISEVRANTDAIIEIIELPSKKQNTKFHRLIKIVNNLDDKKIDFKSLLEKIQL